MIKKIFYTGPEALDAMNGDKGLFAEMVEFHGLRFYYRLGREKAESHWDDGGLEDTLKSNGSHELAKWRYVKRDYDPSHPDEDPSYYLLSGWFELTLRTTITLASGKTAGDAAVHSYKDGLRFGTFFHLERPMLPELARVRVADIEELLARPEEAEKPLSSRERNNLLRVIRALCQQADIDLVNGKGTAQVAKALELAGFDGPKDKTLRALLSEVRKIA